MISEIKLPEGWVEAELQEVAVWGSGGTPSRKYPEYYNGDIPWIKTGDLGPRLITRSSEYITKQAVQNSNAKLFSKNSVVIAMYGATIGKTSILGIDATTNQACAVGLPIENVTTSIFLYYLLLNEKKSFIAKSKGGAQPNISQALIKEHKVPFPSLAEQKIITDKLDTLLAQVDNTKTRLEQIPQILKRFRQAVLAAAVSGKLTEEWRGTAILTDWKKGTLKNFIKKPSYGTSAKSQKEGLIPVLRMGNLQNGKLDWSDLVYTSDKNEIEKYKLIAGDILFNRTNSPELVGKTSIYRGERDAIYAGYLIKVQCLDGLNPEYLNYHLNSNIAKQYCYEVKSDGVSQSNINAQKLAAYPLEVPPINEQHEIVRCVEQLFTYADGIEKQVQNALERVNNLTHSILAKAFRGELTAQWRAENPELISGENSAKSLLVKIQHQRTSIKNIKQRKGKS
ncbi:restriction endonuclease subunit S [Klebsiella aerogenes]|uniref:Restriction endonuclease subunit S n=1 Tax=Klebsiella aerogenes TaxID=548 RepID=A0AAW9LTI9_KLEAE|nr:MULTISPECIES: restriction endonuclease subunit S [Enterobacteriaceae]MEA8801239.1 restriction endonuclease subunit S [Klebsiella aerogenes]